MFWRRRTLLENLPVKGGDPELCIYEGRRGQQFFRRSVLAAYDGKCAITSISAKDLLRASHIIPWKDRENTRLDPRNGICLNALHDAAFDSGLISFDTKFCLLVSKQLSSGNKKAEHATPKD